MECETQKSYGTYTKHLNLHWPKKYICRYRINQHLTPLKLDSVSVKSIAAEFVAVKASLDLNLM